jgi:predicted nicotinamide N-methyase
VTKKPDDVEFIGHPLPNSHVAEIVLWNRTLTDKELRAVQKYFRKVYEPPWWRRAWHWVARRLS